MKRTQTLDNVSTKLQRIAELAKAAPQMAIRTLAHHIDVEFLRVAYDRTRKDGAVGVGTTRYSLGGTERRERVLPVERCVGGALGRSRGDPPLAAKKWLNADVAMAELRTLAVSKEMT